MTWHGHRFAFRVRVDVEHVEAQRYIGDYRLTRVAVSNLLDTLAEVDVTVSFAVLGITAELYPNLIADIVGRGHEVYGHGMFHREAFAGRTLADQRHEVDRMRSSIHRACGVQVDGLACPHHGSADENTLRAAAEGGLTFVGSRYRAEGRHRPDGVTSPGPICRWSCRGRTVAARPTTRIGGPTGQEPTKRCSVPTARATSGSPTSTGPRSTGA